MNAANIKLRPCPFCGGKAYLHHNGKTYFVICGSRKKCKVRPQTISSDLDTVVNAWNKRSKK